MSTSTPPPFVPPAGAVPVDDENAPVDSAEADRLAAQGEDIPTVEGQDGEDATNSADADYQASMGEDPENA